MLQILTLVLAMTFSASSVPPQIVPGDLQTPGVTAPGDVKTPGNSDPPDNQGGTGE